MRLRFAWHSLSYARSTFSLVSGDLSQSEVDMVALSITDFVFVWVCYIRFLINCVKTDKTKEKKKNRLVCYTVQTKAYFRICSPKLQNRKLFLFYHFSCFWIVLVLFPDFETSIPEISAVTTIQSQCQLTVYCQFLKNSLNKDYFLRISL